jgi:site-specific DNA-methyltransferase (adenine-specific)
VKIWTPDYRRCEQASVLIADPPWKFDDGLPGKRGVRHKYKPLTVQQIIEYPLPPMHRDAILFLWRVASQQRAALDVAAAWGFEERAELVWNKLTRTGKRHYGMGHFVRMEHEVCLIMVRGRPKILDPNQRSTFDAFASGHYSRKPDEFYEIVKRMVGGPYVELFATRRVPGVQAYGQELARAA